MAQFDVRPVISTDPATAWSIAWDSDQRDADITIGLTPYLLGPHSLTTITDGVFSLGLRDGDEQKPFLTLDHEVWSFPHPGGGYRPLVSGLWPFLDAVAAVEGTQLATGAAAAIRSLIAARLPSTFEESLLVNFGLFRAAGATPRSYVDLLPGMGLSIATAVSQFIPSASAPPAGINGYISAGTTVARLVSTPRGTVVSDPFLAANTVPAVTPGTGGASDVLDLQAVLAARHLRLCYPRTLGASSGAGSVALTDNPALLGADSFANLDAATDAFYNGAAQLPSGTRAAFMRGRATLTPLLQVTFNNATTEVAVGTTVRQLFEQSTTIPRLATALPSSSITFQRVMPKVLLPGASLANLAGVSMAQAAAGSLCDGWDLPLVGGEYLSLPELSASSHASTRER